jgi:hypothetical protein
MNNSTRHEKALANCRKKFQGLDEIDRMNEANKFIHTMTKRGMTVNSCLGFLKDAGVMSDTELIHSLTY